MTTRRSIIQAFGFAAGGIGASAVGGPVHAQEARRVVRFSGLGEIPATNSPVWIENRGWFESRPIEGEPDGLLRIAGPDGRHWVAADFAGTLQPHWFARPEDGGDDAMALQRACDFSVRHGPFRVDLAGKKFACRTRLVIDPTRVVIEGTGAVLDFSAMPEPQLEDPVATLDQIRPDETTSSWRREGRTLIHERTASPPLIHQLSLPREGRYRVTLMIGELSGTSDYPRLRAAVTTADRTVLGGLDAIAPGYHCFEIEGPVPAARLTLDADADLRITDLKIEWQGVRECILVQSGDGSPQYGHKWIEGIEIAGPGAGTRLHGMRFDTRAVSRSSRLNLHDVVVRDFHTGIVFAHRSYLVRGFGIRCVKEIGMHFLGGSEDAGELFSFFGSIIGGGRIAILSNDAEILLDGTSVNFTDQIFVGSGYVTLQACHLEINRPAVPGLCPIDLSVGIMTILGGTFIVTGQGFESGNQCAYIFHLRSRMATATMQDVTTYNLRTTTGALAGGAGRLDTSRMRGRRPRHTAPIVQFDPARNLLGPLPRDGRLSGSATGAFTRHALSQENFNLSEKHDFAWLCGSAQPGAEVGVSFEARGTAPGQIMAMVQALSGESRATIGNAWPVGVATEWQTFRASTGDTHPSASMDGRMPDGWPEVALLLDTSTYDGAIEFRNVFLCAL